MDTLCAPHPAEATSRGSWNKLFLKGDFHFLSMVNVGTEFLHGGGRAVRLQLFDSIGSENSSYDTFLQW